MKTMIKKERKKEKKKEKPTRKKERKKDLISVNIMAIRRNWKGNLMRNSKKKLKKKMPKTNNDILFPRETIPNKKAEYHISAIILLTYIHRLMLFLQYKLLYAIFYEWSKLKKTNVTQSCFEYPTKGWTSKWRICNIKVFQFEFKIKLS